MLGCGRNPGAGSLRLSHLSYRLNRWRGCRRRGGGTGSPPTQVPRVVAIKSPDREPSPQSQQQKEHGRSQPVAAPIPETSGEATSGKAASGKTAPQKAAPLAGTPRRGGKLSNRVVKLRQPRQQRCWIERNNRRVLAHKVTRKEKSRQVVEAALLRSIPENAKRFSSAARPRPATDSAPALRCATGRQCRTRSFRRTGSCPMLQHF